MELFLPRSSALAWGQSRPPGPQAGLFIGRPESAGAGAWPWRPGPLGSSGSGQPGPPPAEVHEQAGCDSALQHAQEAGQLLAARLHALQPTGRLQRLLPRLPPQREEHPLPLHAGASPAPRPAPRRGRPRSRDPPDKGAPFLPPQDRGSRQVDSPGDSGVGSGWWARAGPSPWPYLVLVKFSELFIQTDIFQALIPRAVLQMVSEEVFV